VNLPRRVKEEFGARLNSRQTDNPLFTGATISFDFVVKDWSTDRALHHNPSFLDSEDFSFLFYKFFLVLGFWPFL
jgi:hypothetical protein